MVSVDPSKSVTCMGLRRPRSRELSTLANDSHGGPRLHGSDDDDDDDLDKEL